MLFTVIGLILIIGLAAIAFRTKTSTLYSKITIVALALVMGGITSMSARKHKIPVN